MLSHASDFIISNSGIISLLSGILAVIALGVAVYALILTSKIRRDSRAEAAARITNTNEFVSTIGHISSRLDRTD
jgi:hypothetical protein